MPDKAFVSPEVARLAVFDYFEAFYNRMRMHSALGSITRSIRSAVQSPKVCALGPLSEKPGALHSDPFLHYPCFTISHYSDATKDCSFPFAI